MGWFSKRSSNVVPKHVTNRMSAFGDASLRARSVGQTVSDPQFSWESFLEPAAAVLQRDADAAIERISEAASDDPIARFGGYSLIAEFLPTSTHPKFLQLMDSSLEMLHDRGLSSGHLSRCEADRWIEVHGDLRTSFDGIVDVEPPPPGHVSRLTLDEGDALVIAKMGPGKLDNQFWIERTAAGFAAFSMRIWESGDTILTRCEEHQIGVFDDVADVLRRLGADLRIRPYWSHPELDPFFIERRS